MPKPDVQMVPCLHCVRGPKAEKSCAGGMGVRTLASGCFLGAYLPDKAPKRIRLIDSAASSTSKEPVYKTLPVEWVEAPSYGDAWNTAQAAGYPQWIWVRNGTPGESR